MPLAVPSNIGISRLYRVFGQRQPVETANGRREFGPNTFQVYGNVSWINSEIGAHAVVLNVAGGAETLLPQGATLAKNVLLARYIVPDIAPRTVPITVSLRQGLETASASASLTVDGAGVAAFGTTLSISGDRILLPDWSGAVNDEKDFGVTVNNQSNLVFSLAEARRSEFVPFSDASVALGGLIQGQTYRARYSASSEVFVVTEAYQIELRWPTPQFVVQTSRTIQSYRAAGGIGAELFFVAPAPTVAFAAQGATLRAQRNVILRRRLEANYRATWAISSGNPGGFGIEYVPVNFGTATGPDEAYLVGTPTVSGSFTINLTARRADNQQTTTATINLTVVDTLPRTVVTTNAAIAREGVMTSTADLVNIAFQSTPAPATWAATGLPPGVTIDQSGTISGRPTRPGVFFASVTAQADEFDVSLPTTIKFTVGLGDGTVVTNAAALRAPWLLNQWELTDIHIAARSRVVESTMMQDGALRLKTGDAADFAVFFVDTNDAVFALGPSELRLTIRKADNLDERIVYKSVAPPTAATQEGQTYYLISVTTGNRERETVLEWAEENGNNEALRCVADVDWVKNGKQYSSRSFPLLLELDVTRP